VAGVLVDLDHIPRYIFGGIRLLQPLHVPHMGTGRFLHPFSFLVGGGVLACAGGCLLFLVLRDLHAASKARHTIAEEIVRDRE
jgi:hypothetical protein